MVDMYTPLHFALSLRCHAFAQNCSSNIPINIEIKIKGTIQGTILCQQIKDFFEKIFKKKQK